MVLNMVSVFSQWFNIYKKSMEHGQELTFHYLRSGDNIFKKIKFANILNILVWFSKSTIKE